MKMYLDTPVEKRPLQDRAAVTFELDFPPRAANPACADWQVRAGGALGALRPGRMPGPVCLTLQYEERAGRRDLDALVRPVVDICVKHGIIDGDHRSILRAVNAAWGPVKGVRITIARMVAA